MDSNKKKNIFIKYMLIWTIGCLFIFPIIIFIFWRKKILQKKKGISLIEREMVKLCQVYHKKYVVFFQEWLTNEKYEKSINNFLIPDLKKYFEFKITVSNLNNFLKLHRCVYDKFFYFAKTKYSLKLHEQLFHLNSDFFNKVSIFILTINNKIAQTQHQYRIWPKKFFYLQHIQNKWIVWY